MYTATQAGIYFQLIDTGEPDKPKVLPVAGRNGGWWQSLLHELGLAR